MTFLGRRVTKRTVMTLYFAFPKINLSHDGYNLSQFKSLLFFKHKNAREIIHQKSTQENNWELLKNIYNINDRILLVL